MRKPSLLKKLSGLHIFQHGHHNENADYKAAQHTRHNYELKHPHSGDVSRATNDVSRAYTGPVSSSPKSDQDVSRFATGPSDKPKFAIGDSTANSPTHSLAGSHNPSRQSSTDHLAQTHRSPNIDSSSLTDALNDDPAFIPKPVSRANSTFNFFSRNRESSNGTNVKRSASFSHTGSQPVTIPGVSTDAPMSELSRTLSKASLVGGMGWGHITEKLPSFDTLYTYTEADNKLMKIGSKMKKGQIGEGAGGLVRTARLKAGKHPKYHPGSRGGDLGLFAVKTFVKKRDTENEGFYCAKLVREFRVHCALTHDNIVKLADICVEEKKFGEPAFVAVMDFAVGGDLFDIHYHPYNAIDQGVMSKTERYCVYKQLMYAVNYMHQQGIAHRDIKLENMLVDGHGKVKLADFGTSVFTSGPDAEECKGEVGTDHSMPPEAYLSSTQGPAYDGLKADIWACACVFHFLCFENDNPMAALNAYPFGQDGAHPDNKAWQKHMNLLKRFEPNKVIPGYDLYLERKADKNATPPMTPSIPRQSSLALSSTSGASEGFDSMPDHTDVLHDISANDIKDPLRRKIPFCRFPASSFTSMKGMLDPNPDSRWTAQDILSDHFFHLIECCQKDSNPQGYTSSLAKKKGLQKVHNHIRPHARKLMETNSVEQARNQEQVNELRKQ